MGVSVTHGPTQVWANPENSPGLGGTPETMILEPAAI